MSLTGFRPLRMPPSSALVRAAVWTGALTEAAWLASSDWQFHAGSAALAGLLAAALAAAWVQTRRVQSDLDAHEARQHLETVLEAAELCNFSTPVLGGEIKTSYRIAELFGEPVDSPTAWTRAEILSRVHPDDEPEVHRAMDVAIKQLGSFEPEFRVLWPDGTMHWLQAMGRCSRHDGVTRIDGVLRNIDARRSIEAAFAGQSRRQSLVAAFGHRALMGSNLEQLVESAASIIKDGLGWSHARVMRHLGEEGGFTVESSSPPTGQDEVQVHRCAHGDEPIADAAILSRCPVVTRDLEADRRYNASATLTGRGVRSAIEVPIAGLSGAWGVLGAYNDQPGLPPADGIVFLDSVAHILATVIDRMQAEQRALYLSQFDTLTSLPNRSLMLDRTRQALALSRRRQDSACVVIVDLDRFKAVNDTLGHTAGDELLKLVGQRLSGLLRASDSIGRLACDEFAVLLTSLQQAEDARTVASKIKAALQEPFDVFGHRVHAPASIGVSLFPDHGHEAEELFKNASSAMMRAKRQGNSDIQMFEPMMNELAKARLEVEADLRLALERQEFVLHYQPKANLNTGEISGFEALLRWQHPVRGLVPPLEFISILEDTGLITAAGEWVLREACRQISQWQQAGLPARPVAVNLSARQFRQADLDSMIERVLAESGVPPELLEIEITESMLMDDPAEATRLLERIGASGVRLAVDDFGTGYSSLAYLKRFPLDALKIDRVFVRDVCDDANDAMIAVAIINLAHSLQLRVVAEGVENEAQVEFLRKHGCDEMQGFYFGRPSPAEECSRMLRESKRLPPPVLTLAAQAQDAQLAESLG